MSKLADRSCIPCRGGVPPLAADEAVRLLSELGGEWELVEGHHLSRSYRFENFAQALEYVNRLGAIAEAEGHHPDIHLAWGRVKLDIWTHAIDGLTESDFVLAAKAERAFGPWQGAG